MMRGEEDFGLAQGGGEDLFPAHLELGPGGTDNEFEVAASFGGPAADAGLGEHPLDAGVEQDGVVEVGDFAVVPEVDGGDGRGDELVEGVASRAHRMCWRAVEQVLGLAEVGGEDDGRRFVDGVAGSGAASACLESGAMAVDAGLKLDRRPWRRA